LLKDVSACFALRPLKGTQTLRTTPSAIDYALTLELHRQAHEQHRPCKIGIEPKATVWTDVPLTLHTFFAQRMRYASGFFRAYAINRAMLLRREYGVLGLFELPVRIFTSFFATAEFFLWVTCLLLAIARHRLAATAWLILAAYTMFVIAQLYLSLALAKRFTVYRWRAGFNWLLWLMVPLVAMTWEPIKGVANLAGWIKMPWRQGPWQTLRQGQGTLTC
jgi:cellulose synthase/poly-beta-1,6-N-acetylglucosamine synthase-like glycosyltransferase